MKLLHKLFPLGHFLISLLFIGCGVALITFAALQLWRGVQPWHGLALNERLHLVLDSIAVLTVAVAALELGQTILEEEVQREAQMSVPTRVRRFLSRFMIVLVVSLSIEALVAVFQRIFTQAIFSYLIVNKRIKCYFRENPSGYKSLTLEKSTA